MDGGLPSLIRSESAYVCFKSQRNGHGVHSPCLDKLPILRSNRWPKVPIHTISCKCGGSWWHLKTRWHAENVEKSWKEWSMKRQHGSSLKLIRVSYFMCSAVPCLNGLANSSHVGSLKCWRYGPALSADRCRWNASSAGCSATLKIRSRFGFRMGSDRFGSGQKNRGRWRARPLGLDASSCR